MNKTWIFATMALALGTSCSKEKGIDIDDSSRQEILLGTGSTINVSPVSRGGGAVGGLKGANNWNGETVYVYGITNNAANKAPINGVKAVAPKDVETGKLSWAADEPVQHFYYEGNDKYNFYAVHVDGAAGEDADLSVKAPADLATTGHSVNVTIDGTQDLMVAMPNKDNDILDEEGTGNLEGVENTTNLYSAWSARRGVVPNLVFKHLLSRLNFKAYCGDKPVPADGNELKITSITIKNTINKGSIVVIPAYSEPATEPEAKNQVFDAAEEPNTGDFVIMKKKTGVETTLQPFEEFPLTGTAEEVGEDVLVVPGASYEIEVKTVQNINGEPKEKTQKFELKASDIKKEEASAGLEAFVAGEMYDVTMILYANKEIEIECTLTAWVDGGDATLDEETIEY